MAEVVLESVSKTYGSGVAAVTDLDLAVADGELVVIVGPSGCGKTTTLRMIAGLEPVTSGSISIGGRRVNGIPPEKRDVAMVFQDYALYPHMTVRKNLAFALRMRKVPAAEIEGRVRATAEVLGITDLLDRKPGALSGGQQQRVAVGRAMVREPKCALFDEPLSNLDLALRLQMRAELKAVHRRIGTTTLYVTHDQEEAMTLGDRLVVMHEGRTQQIGAPLDVYRDPANRFVAGFVGSPPMNFVRARVEENDGRLVFTDGHDLRLPANAAATPRTGEIVLGFRPEALRLETGRLGPGVPVSVQVEVTEPLGHSTHVSGTTMAGDRVTARVGPGATCRPGERVSFLIDAAALLLFEPDPLGARI